MAPPYVTISWVGLTALTPLSALIIAWTLVSIHRKRTKSILLLAIVYAQLLFQFGHFAYSTLTLLKMEVNYATHFIYVFNTLLVFKSLSVLSLHLEQFYKVKSPSNYLLNINSSLLKYHLLVVFLLSLMGSYLLGGAELVPPLTPSHRFVLAAYVTFHTVTIVLSLFFLGLKGLLRTQTLDVNVIIGTNSTSSSANLFGIGNASGSSGRRQGIAASGVGAINLLINSSLLMCTFWKFWLPPTWPLINVILWAQVAESLLTPALYWSVQGHRKRQGSSEGQSSGARRLPKQIRNHAEPSYRQSLTSGSLCFNNGEFQYFAGGKHSSNSRGLEGVFNNGLSSEYNTYDSSFHQAQSYTDSLRCASVTTVANDDFEFLPRGHFQAHPTPAPVPFHYETVTINKNSKPSPTSSQTKVKDGSNEKRKVGSTRIKGDKVTASLSMNDLDKIESRESSPSSTSTAESGVNDSDHGKYKYKKNGGRIRKRFTNKGLTRRVLSLESLHSTVNESTLAYLDTGERVIVFTTDFI